MHVATCKRSKTRTGSLLDDCFCALLSFPVRSVELEELLAFDFEAGVIPTFHEDWRLEDPVEAVLSTCSTLLSLVSTRNSQII